MRDTAPPPDRYDELPLYEIRIQGHLDNRWTECFGDLSFTHDSDGTTVLAGPVVDQAALHGLLRKVRDLALTLVSVIRVDRDRPAIPQVDADTESTDSNKEADA
jgi:hypothetical protein